MTRSKNAKKKKNQVAAVAKAGIPNVLNKNKKFKKKVLKEVVKRISKNSDKSSQNKNVNSLLHPRKNQKKRKSNDDAVISIPIQANSKSSKKAKKKSSDSPGQNLNKTRRKERNSSFVSTKLNNESRSNSPQNTKSNNAKLKTPNKNKSRNNNENLNNNSKKKQKKSKKSMTIEEKNKSKKKLKKKDDKNQISTKNNNKGPHDKSEPVLPKKTYSQRQATALSKHQKNKRMINRSNQNKRENRRQSFEKSLEKKLPPPSDGKKLSSLQKFCSTPWFHTDDLLPSMENSTNYSDWFPPLSSVDETAGLDMLEQELHLFHEYVRLSPEEIDARTYFLDHVNDLAQESFARKNKQNRNGRLRGDSWGNLQSRTDEEDSEEEDIKVEVFGSFATLAVCNFTSDVDMALWGAVKVPKHKVFSIDLDDDENNEKNISTKDGGTKILSQSSLLRTMDALKCGGTNNLGDEGNKEKPLSRWRDALSNLDDHDIPTTENKNATIVVLSDDEDESNNHVMKDEKKGKKPSSEFFFNDLMEGMNKDTASDGKDKNVGNGLFVFDTMGVPITLDSNDDSGKGSSSDEKKKPSEGLFVIDRAGNPGDFETEKKDSSSSSILPSDGKREQDEGMFVIDRTGTPGDIDTEKKGGSSSNSNLPSHRRKEQNESLFVIDRTGNPGEVETEKEDCSSKGILSSDEKSEGRGDLFATDSTGIPIENNLVNNCLNDQSRGGYEKKRGEGQFETGFDGIVVEDEKKDSDELNDAAIPTDTKKVSDAMKHKFDSSSSPDLKARGEKNLDKRKKSTTSDSSENPKSDGHFSFQLSKEDEQQFGCETDDNDDGRCNENEEAETPESSKDSPHSSDFSEDDEDSDSADKMASFKNKNRNASQQISTNENGDSLLAPLPVTVRIEATSDEESSDEEIIEISSSSTEKDDCNLEVSGITLTSSNQKTLSLRTSSRVMDRSRATFGPTGRVRTMVISALRTLSKKLWRSEIVQSVELRSRARVPIIALNTRLGFESDIALGGHNGTDTSLYASKQIFRFKSFPKVILLLKTLLRQTDLDKPFTGGLGSYKLYVIVAKHLENHLANGGIDRPSEVLMSFLFRFGNITEFRRSVERNRFTNINQKTILFSDGGEADLAPVFKIDSIVSLFGRCFRRLLDRIQTINKLGTIARAEDAHNRPSLLSAIVNSNDLQRERERCHLKSLKIKKLRGEQLPSHMFQNHPGKVTPGRKVGYVFGRSESNNINQEKMSDQIKEPTPYASKKTDQSANAKMEMLSNETGIQQILGKNLTTNKRPRDGELNTDDEAEQLMAGYGVERGPRGGLIPKSRPDVEARNNEKARNPMIEVIRRGSKNRKNKKKQKRDKALKQFADSELEWV